MNNCSSLLLLVALLSYNNNCGRNLNCCNNNCNCCNNNCGNCNCGSGSSTSLGIDAGMLCLLLAFLTSTCVCNPCATGTNTSTSC